MLERLKFASWFRIADTF